MIDADKTWTRKEDARRLLSLYRASTPTIATKPAKRDPCRTLSPVAGAPLPLLLLLESDPWLKPLEPVDLEPAALDAAVAEEAEAAEAEDFASLPACWLLPGPVPDIPGTCGAALLEAAAEALLLLAPLVFFEPDADLDDVVSSADMLVPVAMNDFRIVGLLVSATVSFVPASVL